MGRSFGSLHEYRIRFDYCTHIVAPHFQAVGLLCRSRACFLLGRDRHDWWTTSWKLPLAVSRSSQAILCDLPSYTRVAGPDVRYCTDVEAVCGLRSLNDLNVLTFRCSLLTSLYSETCCCLPRCFRFRMVCMLTTEQSYLHPSLKSLPLSASLDVHHVTHMYHSRNYQHRQRSRLSIC